MVRISDNSHQQDRHIPPFSSTNGRLKSLNRAYLFEMAGLSGMIDPLYCVDCVIMSFSSGLIDFF